MTLSTNFSLDLSLTILIFISFLTISNHITANELSMAHLSPAVNGQLFRLNKPLSGVKIIRKLTYITGTEITEITQTDREGNFKFVEKNLTSGIPSSLHHESSTSQVIIAKWRNVYHILWQIRPSSSKEDRIITNHLSDLTCDITDNEETYILQSDKYTDAKHLLYSICDIDGTRATLQYAWAL